MRRMAKWTRSLAWLGLVGCSFQPATTGAAADLDAATRAPDGQLITADARPDAASTCATTTCPAACENTAAGAVCYAAATCAQAQQHGAPANASTMLYVGGDPTKPWTAYCDGANEFLAVPMATNYSQYTAGGASAGTSVRTTFSMVRINPTTFVVDIANLAHATSSGGPLTHSSSGTAVTSMPYAVAMDCKASGSTTGVASIDLTGTPFVVTATFASVGSNPGGAATPSGGGRKVALTGGGYCGWFAPTGVTSNPFDPTASLNVLGLAYTP